MEKKESKFWRGSLPTVVLRSGAVVSLCCLLAGCSKEPADLAGPVAGTTPVALSAGVTVSGSTGDVPQTRAIIEGEKFPAMTDALFLTALSGTGSTAPEDWTSPYIYNKPMNSDDNGVLSWPSGSTEYYPADHDQNVWFYAYSPAGTIAAGNTATAPVVTYDISGGQMDIMAAQVTAPVTAVQRTNPVALNFTHKLMQVKFAVKCDDTFLTGQKVTNITITGVPTTGKLDIGSGALELSGSGNVTAYDNSTGSEITAAAQDLPGGVTIGERTASKTLTLNVTAGGVTYSGITVNLTGTDAGKAGMTHTVTLTFKRYAISATASIATWTTNGTNSEVEATE